jgi:hypothetical protein
MGGCTQLLGGCPQLLPIVFSIFLDINHLIHT